MPARWWRQLCRAPTLAITNDPASPLARAAELVLDLRAGEERAVAATKTYVASLAVVAGLVLSVLGVVAFSMSMVGTFLVRSGILTSVHAFAVDPERGSFILVLLAIYIGCALTLFGLRAATISEGERFALTSREGALVINNVALSATLGT